MKQIEGEQAPDVAHSEHEAAAEKLLREEASIRGLIRSSKFVDDCIGPEDGSLRNAIIALIATAVSNRDFAWSNALWPTNPEGETEPLTPEQGAAWMQAQGAALFAAGAADRAEAVRLARVLDEPTQRLLGRALALAVEVRHAYERDDPAAMRVFGTNLPQRLADDVERGLALGGVVRARSEEKP